MDGDANSIRVAVRVRPFSEKELPHLVQANHNQAFIGDGCLSAPSASSNLLSHRSMAIRPIVRVVDTRVLVFDPPETNPSYSLQKQILGPSFKKVKDMRFVFDRVFEEDATQEEVYEGSAKELVGSVMQGFNATVFAYGATGCGKTHTISGNPSQPGIVFLLMKDLFEQIEAKKEELTVEVTISYLEIYNETIRDLLVGAASPILQLREGNNKVTVPGLSEHTPTSAAEVVEMIHHGNANRTVSPTEANSQSSRSHGVLSINVKQRPRTADISESYSMATMSVIDLAGSERASVTKNKGERLLEGANINKSLLALGNCINALCQNHSRAHVPYRNSKLTRLLKHSLGGNCKTVMIVCVSPSSQHYDETHNTLQYANRAKEIKTKVSKNLVSVDRHVSQYVRVIFELKQELEERKKEDGEREEKGKMEERKEREKALRESDDALLKIKMLWSDVNNKIVHATKAKTHSEAVNRTILVISAWKLAISNALASNAPLDVFAIKSELVERADTFIRSTGKSVANLAMLASSVDAAFAGYQNQITSLKSKLRHPEAQKVFGIEVATLIMELEKNKAVASFEGLKEAEKVKEKAMAVMAGGLTRISREMGRALRERQDGQDDEVVNQALVELMEKVNAANQNAFLSFASSSGFDGTGSSAVSTSHTDGPATTFDALSGNPWVSNPALKRPATVTKDDSDIVEHSFSHSSALGRPSYSSNADSSVRAGKMRRASLAGHMQSNSSFSGLLSARKSPKKFRAGLRSAVLSPRKRSGTSNAGAEKAKKSVVWKDEAGEGWDLEECRSAVLSGGDMSIAMDADASSGEMSVLEGSSATIPNLFGQPTSAASTSGSIFSMPPTISSAPVPVQNPPAGSTTPPLPPPPTTQAGQLAALLERRSGLMSSDFLNRKKTQGPSRGTALSSLGEDDEEQEVLADNTTIEDGATRNLAGQSFFGGRHPLGDMGVNRAWTSAINTPSGLAAPLVADSHALTPPKPTPVPLSPAKVRKPAYSGSTTPRKGAQPGGTKAGGGGGGGRRVSLAGPVRSAKKGRRHSYIPQPQASNRSTSSSSTSSSSSHLNSSRENHAGDESVGNISTSATSTASYLAPTLATTLRARRVPASVIPSSARKSPRKVTRRSSLVPGPSHNPTGNIARRRESLLSARSGRGSGSGSGGDPNASIDLGRSKAWR